MWEAYKLKTRKHCWENHTVVKKWKEIRDHRWDNLILWRWPQSCQIDLHVCGCYQVQAHSAHLTTGQWIREERNTTLFGKSADRGVGRLTSQNDHALWAWMLAAFRDERWGKWGHKVKKTMNSCNDCLEWQPQAGGYVISIFLTVIHRWAGSDHLPVSYPKVLGLRLRQRE